MKTINIAIEISPPGALRLVRLRSTPLRIKQQISFQDPLVSLSASSEILFSGAGLEVIEINLPFYPH